MKAVASGHLCHWALLLGAALSLCIHFLFPENPPRVPLPSGLGQMAFSQALVEVTLQEFPFLLASLLLLVLAPPSPAALLALLWPIPVGPGVGTAELHESCGKSMKLGSCPFHLPCHKNRFSCAGPTSVV